MKAFRSVPDCPIRVAGGQESRSGAPRVVDLLIRRLTNARAFRLLLTSLCAVRLQDEHPERAAGGHSVAAAARVPAAQLPARVRHLHLREGRLPSRLLLPGQNRDPRLLV